MTTEQFKRERIYQIMLAISKTMHKQGILTTEELAIVDTKLCDIYKPLLATLYPLEPIETP